jgi:hypothetical protein
MTTYEIILIVLCSLVALAIVKVSWVQRRWWRQR